MTEADVPTQRAAAPARRTGWLKVLGAVALLVALVGLGREAGSYVFQFAQWVQTLGVWGPLVFIAGYALAVVALGPGSILTLGAGAIFGLAAGSVYVFVAASTGACLAFLIGRYFARDAIERRLSSDPRFDAIARAVGAEGLKITFLLRLSPVFPFSLLNYGLGLTRVSFRNYALACFGMIPGTILYVYLGSVVGDLARIASGETGADAGTQNLIFIVGLVVTGVVTWGITRIARRALRSATEEGVVT